MADKLCDEMDFIEFKDWATRYVFDSLITEGLKGLKRSLHVVMEQILSNKIFGGKSKKKPRKKQD